MPLITNGDVTTGILRRRKIIEAVILKTLEKRSTMIRNYAQKMSEFLEVPVEKIRRSKPFRNYVKKITGI